MIYREEEFFWFVEGPMAFGDLRRVALRQFPAIVGRGRGCDVQLISTAVSTQHAEFFRKDGQLWLRDLDSTNGTLVNFERVSEETQLRDGDVLHFGDLELNLSRFREDGDTASLGSTTLYLTRAHAERSRAFRDVLQKEAISPYCQPIVSLAEDAVLGYEILSRAHVDGSVTLATEIFEWAEIFGQESRLSELCRRIALQEMTRMGTFPQCPDGVFVNTHPSEMLDDRRLIQSLGDLRRFFPEVPIVVEIHEGATSSVSKLRFLRQELHQLDMKIAFDDFGKGSSRLMAIADVPPDYLKFDREFLLGMADIASRRVLVRDLVAATRGLGVEPIAEGIETPEEAAMCAEAGFVFGQGYLFGRPAPLASWLPKSPHSGTESGVAV